MYIELVAPIARYDAERRGNRWEGRQVEEQDMGRTRLVARNEMGLRSETGETGRETLKKASSPNLGNKDLGREVSVRQLGLMLGKDCKEWIRKGSRCAKGVV